MNPTTSFLHGPFASSRRSPSGPGLPVGNAAGRWILTLVLLAGPLAGAEPNESSRLDGTWKWSFAMPDGSKIEPKAILKREGDKITGTSFPRPGHETTIAEGKIQDHEVSWVVVREQDGHKVTTRYHGKLSGNTIKGAIESDWAGDTRSYDWEAKRLVETPDGTWRWDFMVGARRIETRAKLKAHGEKLTGKAGSRSREADVSDGKFKGDEISFDLIRERDGIKFAMHFKGKLDGDTINGEMEFEFGGENYHRPWKATRETE